MVTVLWSLVVTVGVQRLNVELDSLIPVGIMRVRVKVAKANDSP